MKIKLGIAQYIVYNRASHTKYGVSGVKMRLRNQLWKPRSERKKPKIKKRKPPEDEICEDCINHKVCLGYCPPLIWIDGRQETKELIPIRPIINGIPQIEYNEEIYNLMSDKESKDIERLEAIRTISDYRIRMIAAATLAHIPQAQIAKITHSSQSRISRKYRIVTK